METTKKFTTIHHEAEMKAAKQQQQKKRYQIPPAYYHQECQLFKEDVRIKDEATRGHIRSVTSDWPQRYFERFQRWYVRRCEKTAHLKLPKQNFDMWSCINSDDVLKHLKNWDSSLRKACIKSLRLRNTVNRIQKDCNKTVTTYQKRWSNKRVGQPPHPHFEQEQASKLG